MYPKKQPKSDREKFYGAFQKKVGCKPEQYLRRKLAGGMQEAELRRLYDMLAVEIAMKARCTAIRYDALQLEPAGETAAERHVRRAATHEVPVCARCGGRMVLRTGQTGARKGQKFWGCSNYPACRYTKDFEERVMRNFKFIISYDGSRYFGWERQPGRDTIQGKLEAVLTRMCGTDVQVIGAGRTDAGVHARAMAANAYMDTEKTPEEIRDYMNRLPAGRYLRAGGESLPPTASTRATAPSASSIPTPAMSAIRSRSSTGNTSPCSITSLILPPCSARRRFSPANMITKASARTRR